MSTPFVDLDLHPSIVQAIAELGFTDPTPIQSALIPVLLEGRDAIGQAQTGTGKTAAFGLPLLHKISPGAGKIQALVLVPTRELAIQVASALFTYGKERGIRPLPIYGGQPYQKQLKRLRRGVDVVVGTPGRLLDLLGRGALDLSAATTVVLDEADEMLSMGFIEDIETILDATPSTRQTALLSATLPSSIRKLAAKYLNNPATCTIDGGQRTASTVEQRAYRVHGGDKMAALVRLLEAEPIESVLVFTHTRASTAELAAKLSDYGYAAEPLSGELSQDARTETLGRFRSKRIQILVGTDVAARGLDIDHISHVVNFDLPRDPEAYVHRIGRTGRAGKTGVALALVRPDQKGLLRAIERYTKQQIPYIPLPTIEDVQALRRTAFLGKVKAALSESPEEDPMNHLVQSLVNEGHDVTAVAAAAFAMARAAEPAAELPAVGKPSSKSWDKSSSKPWEKSSGKSWEKRARSAKKHAPTRRHDRSAGAHEAGMVRVRLDKGFKEGVRPNQVVSTLARTVDIPGRSIGKILIEDRQTLVDVPEQFAAQVLGHAGGYRLGKSVARAQRHG